MKYILGITRYLELLKKAENLNREPKSLIFENEPEFLEFLSFGAYLQNSVSYQNRKKYYSLISN